MNARHRKPGLATAVRVTGAAAVAFQLTGLVLVTIGGGLFNLGVFAMTLAAFAVFAHVVYRRTPAVTAKRADAALVAEVKPSGPRVNEMPTVPGMSIGLNPNVTTVKITPRRRHQRPESKK